MHPGPGCCAIVSLRQARELAARNYLEIKAGNDPFERARPNAPTLRNVVEETIKHRYPPGAVDLLERPPTGFGLAGRVFPSARGRPMNARPLSEMLRDLKIGGVPHGFRSSFREWARETTEVRDAAEASLGHVIADATEVAYGTKRPVGAPSSAQAGAGRLRDFVTL